MSSERKTEFVQSIGIGLLVSAVLALGHVMYGINFMEMTAQDIALLDSYVFFLSYGALALISGMFYFLKEDLSSSIAVFLSGFWALTFGLEDIIVYLYLGYFRETYPWLIDTPAGIVANIIGTEVTTFALFLNAAVFGYLTALLVYGLYNYEEEIYGMEI